MISGPVAMAVFALLSASFLLTLLRLLRGPTLSDRVVALDLLGIVIVAIIGANMLTSGETTYLDVFVVFAVVVFFGTVALARYIEKRLQDDD
jgi:multicomponent Na+:H+ antiporter subunit F